MRAINLVLIGLVLVGCASTDSGSTRIRDDDLDAIVHEMIQSLAASDFLSTRTADSPSVSIMINKVQNLSSDVVTEAEQWRVVARIRGAVPLAEFARTKNIIFQITRPRHAMLVRSGYVGDLGPTKLPTHLMAATFRSIRRAGHSTKKKLTDLRADTYYMEFRITNLETRELEWVGEFLFKREATGLLID